MNSMIRVVFFSAYLSLSVGALDQHRDYLQGQTFLPREDVLKKWGEKSFESTRFKEGNLATKASMAGSLMKSNSFKGKAPKEVREALGGFTGYFWSDRVPAYIIEEGWKTSSDTWQIVFLLDESGAVSSVKVHKNCCNK